MKFEEVVQRILLIGTLPLFLIAAAVEFWIDSSRSVELERFVDQWLPSQGGMWISAAPLLCKVIASYAAMAMPVLAVALFCCVHQHQPALGKIQTSGWRIFLQVSALAILFNALFINIVYFNNVNFDDNRRGMVFANPLMMVVSTVAIMWMWGLILVVTYKLFILYPLTVLKARRALR